MGDLRIPEAWAIVRSAKLLQRRFLAILGVSYGATLVNGLLDGASAVVLVSLLKGGLGSDASQNPVLDAVARTVGGRLSLQATFALVVGLLFLRALFDFIESASEGQMGAAMRRRIQEACVRGLLTADWETLRRARIGQAAGAVTEEASTAAKYIISATRIARASIALVVLVTVALFINAEVTVVLVIAAVPIVFFLRRLFSTQARWSSSQAAARQSFAADAVDRLAGLQQIKVEGDVERHVQEVLREQPRMTRLETLVGYCQAAIGAGNVLLPAIALAAFMAWAGLRGVPLEGALPLLAGLAVVGVRASAQVNTLLTSWGNLSRLAGSIGPVYALLRLPREVPRAGLPEGLTAVEVEDVTYLFEDGGSGAREVSLRLVRGDPLVLRGPSGSGKTTVAALVAGLCRPQKGRVEYVGVSGRRYASHDYRPRVGYVTQDIYLFHGTLRDNLRPSAEVVDDDVLWARLREVGAADFVRAMGGLDAPVHEGGKSLSGGERRRLGIARVLAASPDLIVFDEVQAGLDPSNRRVVERAIRDASRQSIVLIVTHEDDFNDLRIHTMAERTATPHPTPPREVAPVST